MTVEDKASIIMHLEDAKKLYKEQAINYYKAINKSKIFHWRRGMHLKASFYRQNYKAVCREIILLQEGD